MISASTLRKLLYLGHNLVISCLDDSEMRRRFSGLVCEQRVCAVPQQRVDEATSRLDAFRVVAVNGEVKRRRQRDWILKGSGENRVKLIKSRIQMNWRYISFLC